MSPDEFFKWANAVEGGFTTQAYNEGIAAIGDAAKLADLKARQEQALAEYNQASNATKNASREEQAAASDTLMSLGSKVQFFNEAVGAAENTGSAKGAPEVRAAHEAVTLSKLPADIAANVTGSPGTVKGETSSGKGDPNSSISDDVRAAIEELSGRV